MATEIKCPGCGHGFLIEDVITEQYKVELRSKMLDFTKQKEEDFRRKEDALKQREAEYHISFEKRLETEEKQLRATLEETLRTSISADYQNELLILKKGNDEAQDKLKVYRENELVLLQKATALQEKEEEIELRTQRELQVQRLQLSEHYKKQEAQLQSLKEHEHQLKVKELEKQLSDQVKLVEEMKRRAYQGSMQLQGEVQELMLEEMLRSHFPFDQVKEVGKGVRGADCIQTIRNKHGQECGRIIFESKRTKDFSADWIDKLKTDMRSQAIDVAVIVSSCYPRGMDCFGELDGVWICSFDEFKAVVSILRDSIIKLHTLRNAQENKGDKMNLLYTYLTNAEFNEQWKAIREGFLNMRMSILREREAMEKLWKSREKQLDKVLTNAAQIKGSIEGIAGSDTIQLSLTDDEGDVKLLD